MKNKFLYIIIGLIFSSKALFCQSDSAKYYIGQLDWKSFTEGTSYVQQLFVGETIENLVKLDDSKKIDLLFKSLNDTTKTVAIHITLTKIFDPLYTKFGSKVNTGEGTSFTYGYNNLYWTRAYNLTNEQIGSIRVKDVESIIQYWKIIIEIRSHSPFLNF